MKIFMIIPIVGVILAVVLSAGRSRRVKYVIWGITTSFILAPFISAIAGNLYGVQQAEGFAGVALIMIMFPLIFLLGIVILVIGVSKKERL